MVTETEPKTETQPEVSAEVSEPSKVEAQAPKGDGGTAAEATAAKAVGTDAALEAFDAEAILQEVSGTKAPPPQPTRLPGKSAEEVDAEERQNRDASYRSLLTEGKPRARRALSDLSDDEFNGVWEAVSPLFGSLHSNNEAYNLLTIDATIRQALTEDEHKLYSGRDFAVKDEQGRLLPIASRVEAFKGIVAIGRELERQGFEAKVHAGEYLTRKQAAEAVQVGFDKGRGVGERTKASAESGTVAEGGVASGSGESYAERLKGGPMPSADEIDADTQRWLAQHR